MISQSAMESQIYTMCQEIRDASIDALKVKLQSSPLELPPLENAPILNQQIKNRLRVMLSLITAIVGRESGEFKYMLNDDHIEVEHIWCDHFENHTDEFESEADFANVRNSIGDLLVLPKSFNDSYGDDIYEDKVKRYYSQNILAQTLCQNKYDRAPGFLKFVKDSGLPFKPYEHFKKADIEERNRLYMAILKWDFDR